MDAVVGWEPEPKAFAQLAGNSNGDALTRPSPS